MTLSAQHATHLQLRFHDADLLGIAHHTTVLHLCDSARLAWLASRQVEPFALPIRNLEVRYGAPLNVLKNPVVSVHSTFAIEPLHGGRVAVQSEHVITGLDGGTPFATVVTEYAANRDDIAKVQALIEAGTDA